MACPGFAQNSEIQNIVVSGRLEGMRWPNFPDLRASLQEFYEPAGFAPAWVKGTQPVPTAVALIGILQHAGEKGLNPEDYDAPQWQERIHALRHTPEGLAVARFDVALTVCAMRYVSALHMGRINPRHVEFGMDVKEKELDLAAFVRHQILRSSNVQTVLEGIEPAFVTYHSTEKALMRYVELARLDDGEKLPPIQKTVDPGQAFAGVPRLARLLRLVGDLPKDAAVSPDSQIYGPALVAAVKRFQQRHGLDEDGRIGNATLRQLNVPLQHRVRQLQLSLERWRWLPAAFSAPPIFVNIPDFRLRALGENGKVVLEMRVVVGRAMRTQTPVFSAEMTHVIFRPYWNVPRSIVRKEILPDVRRDREYLVRKHFEVTTHDGAVVTSGEVNDEILAQLKEGTLTVRQTPGPDNALGLVKLVFPNDNDVYLHDTPATKLFARSRRDFSHGCIRVEEPAELAAWVLRNNPGWTLERVQEAMQSGEDDVIVNLAKRVPVFIVYGTALAYDNGEVHFSDDIYGFDAQLSAALARGYPYP